MNFYTIYLVQFVYVRNNVKLIVLIQELRIKSFPIIRILAGIDQVILNI